MAQHAHTKLSRKRDLPDPKLDVSVIGCQDFLVFVREATLSASLFQGNRLSGFFHGSRRNENNNVYARVLCNQVSNLLCVRNGALRTSW